MNTRAKPIKIAVVDDHHLFRSGLINLVGSFGEDYKVIMQANNGKEFIVGLENNPLPDIVLMDLNMPVMDGFETSALMQKKFPQVKVLVITMVEDEKMMIRMLKLGIKGYLSKDVEPEELKKALDITSTKGFYYTDHVTGKLISAMHENADTSKNLNEREQKFLELACSEYTYKEIADQMHLSIKTIDGYRNNLFEKLEVKSRVGLVLYALKNNLVSLK
jgi:two-component system invasion response regulator UvrY